MTDPSSTVSLALLSHTNVGKTTLARTLLRRDIGAVLDRAHVTEIAESHVLMRTGEGDELVLWDTPGFGDSVRLLRRLEGSGNPVGWFLAQVWDRFADRPFWCSQQALRAARESADVLLYVVNATEDPESAGYVEPELRILEWIGKPALVLLNQLGTRSDPARGAAIEARWNSMLAARAPGIARRVLSFDAFARCWLQEHALLAAIGSCVDESRRAAFARLAGAWRRRDIEALQKSAAVIAGQLAALAQDEERVPEPSLTDKARRWLVQGGAGREASPEEQRAQESLLARLDASVRDSTAALVELHGLTGDASSEIIQRMGKEFATQRAQDADRAGIIGGLVSGALGGLAADLAAGGLTLGAGALLGGVAGAFGARKLTQQYNALRGIEGGVVRWSDEFLEARLAAAIVRYLAVAHFGRGRGEFEAGEPAPRWRDTVDRVLQSGVESRGGLWAQVRATGTATARLEQVARDLLWNTLAALYPAAASEFSGRQAES